MFVEKKNIYLFYMKVSQNLLINKRQILRIYLSNVCLKISILETFIKPIKISVLQNLLSLLKKF